MEDRDLRVITAIEEYLIHTKPWRKDRKQLLLGHVNPVKLYQKDTLKEEDIAADIYKGHSTH